MKAAQPASVTIRQIEFELPNAWGCRMTLSKVVVLRNMLREARKRKLSRALAAKRDCPEVEFSACRF